MEPFDEYGRELRERDLAPLTKARYQQILNSFRHWLDGREPTPALAQSFISYHREKGYQPRSLCLYYAALKGFFNFLGQPLKLKLRKPQGLPKFWDAWDIERLLAQAERGVAGQSEGVKKRNYALLTVMAFCGLRRAEVLGLRLCDVNFRHRTVRVLGKGGKERVIPMPRRVVAALLGVTQGKRGQDRLFNINARNCYKMVVKLARAAGMDGFHPHSARHFFASRLLELGANVRIVQQLLGHSDLSSTMVYLDIAPRHLEGAVGLLDGGLEVQDHRVAGGRIP